MTAEEKMVIYYYGKCNKLEKKTHEQSVEIDRLTKTLQHYDALIQIYQTFLVKNGASPKVLSKFQELASKRAAKIITGVI